MPKQTVPRRPTGLSDQEEEDLRALEQGYDADAGALPDRDPPPSAEPPSPAAPRRPLEDAETHGMVPRPGTVAPPLDEPENNDPEPAPPGDPVGH